MKTEKEILKQLNDVQNSNDIGYGYRKTYIDVLNWVLEKE